MKSPPQILICVYYSTVDCKKIHPPKSHKKEPFSTVNLAHKKRHKPL